MWEARQIEKLMWLRSMGAHLLDLSMLPNERRRFLATVGTLLVNSSWALW